VTIPSSVNSIGLYAFEYCSSLRTVAIPSTVTSIGGNAFSDCTNLKYVTYDGLSDLPGRNPFSDCEALEFACVPPEYSSTSFAGITNLCKSADCF